MIAARKEMWRELNELNEQVLRLEQLNGERLDEIDRLRSETDEIKRQNEVRSDDSKLITGQTYNKR